MNKFRDKLENFMQGRYGIDQLGRFMLYAALALIILSFFFRGMFLNTAALVLLVLCYIRMFSRNHAKRWAENEKFLSIKDRIFGRGRHRDAAYCYFKCPACGQKVRVPRGKGRISIRCPRCNNDFIKRT
ncbi:MAG TPA: hypothetical protein IAB71_04120 [Candidatus Scatomonas pullistercoris]|uniref:Zn-finger containing protein n=1 Tax=Candidatus Scatomonas pullistercoris TaxID=2840920 RepID=A0A9D1P1Q2_9FIRM|nr:hypothetical protein [Candidatus Scatomonas pullistercoris]